MQRKSAERHAPLLTASLVLAFVTAVAAGCAETPAKEVQGPTDAAMPGVDATPSRGDASAAGAADASSPALDAAADAPSGTFTCTADSTFPSTIPVPEASAAAEVELTAGVRELLVVSDSGNAGKAVLVSLAQSTTRAITLPLEAAASDDLEGIAWRSGHLYTLTSSGAVRRFAPDGTGGLVRDQDAYALGVPPAACADLTAVNCGRNYEGLCLRSPTSPSPSKCAGYAASKAEATLYCLTVDGTGHLVASTTEPPIALAIAGDRLSDCAFGTAGGTGAEALVVATNIYNLSKAYRVDEATGMLTLLDAGQVFNLESIAIDAKGALYTFSDDNSTGPSGASKKACTSW